VQRSNGLESKDPYMVALAANIMLNVDPSGADTGAIVKRLAGLQAKDGSFPGAAQTITMSGGESLVIETTSLAVSAFVKAKGGEHEGALRSSVEWLNNHRGGWGEWGSTQGTVLSLRALSAYADHSRQTQADGAITLKINGKDAGRLTFEKGHRDALVFDDIAGKLTAGKNTIELALEGDATLPYSIAVEYRSAKPQSSDKAKVAVTTKLAKTQVSMGEGVKLRAHIENKTKDGVPMTLARVGIPGGLTFQTWQLKELKDKKVIDFYETRQREVILYFRAMAPNDAKDIDLDLLASVPGTYVAPATSAYLYYTDEDKSWAAPLQITVAR
jgi:alpha-2-macroglobulin-like protein